MSEPPSVPSNVRTYRKKPIDVKAYLWDGNINLDLPPGTIYSVYEMSEGHIYGKIRSREGELTIRAGEHYIVGPGAKGEYWPVEREIFEATYEEFSGDSSASETKAPQPIAWVVIAENGGICSSGTYAPGLPEGTHDLYYWGERRPNGTGDGPRFGSATEALLQRQTKCAIDKTCLEYPRCRCGSSSPVETGKDECQHDLLKQKSTIAVDPADAFHAWCTVCKHDFRTRAPLEVSEPLNLACEGFVPDAHSRFCDRCGYPQHDHHRPSQKASAPQPGDSCPVCANGRIGQSGIFLRCSNCGWMFDPTLHTKGE